MKTTPPMVMLGAISLMPMRVPEHTGGVKTVLPASPTTTNVCVLLLACGMA